MDATGSEGVAEGAVVHATVVVTSSGPHRIEWTSPSGPEGERTLKVEKLDPRTGKGRWTYKVSQGIQRVHPPSSDLPSSDPPVLAVAAGDSRVTALLSLDAGGRHRATITLGGTFDPEKVFFPPREPTPDPEYPTYPVRAVLGIESVA